MRVFANRLSMLIVPFLWVVQGNSPYAFAGNLYSAGDQVVVAQANTPLMRGHNTLGTFSRGQQLSVLKTEGDWIGTRAVVNGQTVAGWVHQGQLITPPQYAQRRTVRRSYSYQPGMATGNYGYSNGGSRSSSNRGLIMGATPYGPSYWRADRKIKGY